MRHQIPFIDREDELALIDDLIGEWGTRYILCVNGLGGIGKTRLLQEVVKRYRDEKTPRLLVPDVIDFADPDLHIAQNLGRKIAELLNGKAFAPYLQWLVDWRKMEIAGVSPERLTEEGLAVDQAFVESFNTISATERVVLLLDTLDALIGTDSLRYVLSLGLQLTNCVIVVAGRNAKMLFDQVQPKLETGARLLELSSLEPTASEEYLQRKQEQLHVSLGTELSQKLLFLAQGRPIILDLAVEWLARDIPLPWLTEARLEELQELDEAERKKRQAEFELHLVRHIADIRTPMDRLTLVMSRVYSLTADMVGELLSLSPKEARRLFEHAQTYVFVKPLPGERITLHDNFREMIEELWPEIDPGEDRRRRDSQRAVSYLEKKLENLREQIGSLEKAETAAQTAGDAPQELMTFMKRELLERELWVLAGQQLEHLLFIDLDRGIKSFADMFEEATTRYRFSFREVLIDKVQQYYESLTPTQRYEVDSRRAKQWLDQGEYQKAKALAQDILGREGLLPGQQTDMLIQLGNIETRLGNLRTGVENFEQAVSVSSQAGLREWLLPATIALGWGYRLTGRLDKATALYRDALALSIDLEDMKRQAWVLNNLAFVHARRGEAQAALALCKQAENIWEKLDFDRGMGGIYEVYGEAYTRFEWLEEALRYYQKALEIFGPRDDTEWLARIYAERGRAYWLMGEYSRAKEDLEHALSMKVSLSRPLVLHYLGHVHESLGNLDKAAQYFQESYEISKAAPDAYFELNGLGDLIRLAVENGQYHLLEQFEDVYREYCEIEWPDEYNPRYNGLLLKYLGDLALGARPGDIGKAGDYYAEGLPLIVEHETFHPFSIEVQLQRIDGLLETLPVPPKEAARLGKRLLAVWKERKLEQEHPEALSYFLRWKKQGEMDYA